MALFAIIDMLCRSVDNERAGRTTPPALCLHSQWLQVPERPASQATGFSLAPKDAVMPNLKRLRAHAFSNQGGLCYYCNAPMWESSPAELPDLGRTPFARALRCTAEHLQAREDGGRNTRNNIVPACWHCNSLRHRRKRPLAPERYDGWSRHVWQEVDGTRRSSSSYSLPLTRRP